MVQSAEVSCSTSVRASRRGRMEKYLYRQGSQRYAGTPRKRQANDKPVATCSGAIRFTSWFPQIGQCSRKESLSGIKRA